MDRIQRSESICARIAADRRRPCGRRICAGQSRATPAVVRRLGVVRDVRADGLRSECPVGTGRSADRRNHRSQRPRDGPYRGRRSRHCQPAASLSEQIQLGDPVVLLRAPFRLSFSYAGRDRVWKSSWHEADRLPAAIMLTVRDAATERVLSVSTVASIHAEAPAAGNCAQPGTGCDDKADGTDKNSKDNSKANSNPANAAPGQGGSP